MSSNSVGRTVVDMACQHCGTSFSVNPCVIRGGGGKYCSKACYFNFRRAADETPRFMKKIAKDGPNGCWRWLGATHEWGYGKMYFRGKADFAHRIAWILFRGQIPDGLHVCHDCPGGDNPNCCNPDHLFLGTNTENRRDSVRKGTHAHGDKLSKVHKAIARRGQDVAHSKLTDSVVSFCRAAIRCRLISYAELSRQFGVTYMAIYNAVSGKTWSHVFDINSVVESPCY